MEEVVERKLRDLRKRIHLELGKWYQIVENVKVETDYRPAPHVEVHVTLRPYHEVMDSINKIMEHLEDEFKVPVACKFYMYVAGKVVPVLFEEEEEYEEEAD